MTRNLSRHCGSTLGTPEAAKVVAPSHSLEEMFVSHTTEAHMSPPKVSEPEWGGDVYDPLHHVLGDVVTRHSSPPGIKLQPKNRYLHPCFKGLIQSSLMS